MKKLIVVVCLLLLCACTPRQLAIVKLHSLGYVTNTDARADRAIRHWQRINGLEVDGIVGPATLGSLGLDGAQAGVPAVRVAPPAPPPEPVVDGPCSEWWPTAASVGWSLDDWNRLKRIMYRESRCNPGVHNRSGATGLLQIMPMWADDCGGTPSMLFDPTFNLACGLHILTVQGWGAWAV